MFALFVSLCGICLLNAGTDGQRVVATITVSNGGSFGDWGPEQYCADGAYATGYNMKIEPYQSGGDDTELNAVQLICRSRDGSSGGGTAESTVGQWGNWVGQTACSPRGSRKPFFFTAFALQVEKAERYNADNTEANYIKFQCRDFNGTEPSYELVRPPGQGTFGTYASWSESCPIYSAICGISTRVERPQGNGDDTALNDVRLFCCQDSSLGIIFGK